jgi:hypothetical protein
MDVNATVREPMPRTKPLASPELTTGVAPAGAAVASAVAGADRKGELQTLMATGLPRWDAMVALVAAGVAPGEFPELRGAPSDLLREGVAMGVVQAAIEGVAVKDPELANDLMNAYLAGRAVDGNLEFAEADWITWLPEGLVVRGDLSLSESSIQRLPEGLVVEGNCYLQRTFMTTLPRGLTIGGDLDLEGADVEDLPPDLKVGGKLDLTATQVEEVPATVVVGGSLLAGETRLGGLPGRLRIHGDLDLRGTAICELAAGTEVDGDLRLTGTRVCALPDGLRVGEDLSLSGSQLVRLPAALVVGKDLWLHVLPTWDGRLPEDLQVGGLVRNEAFPEGLTLAALRERSDPRRERVDLDALVQALMAPGMANPLEAARQVRASMNAFAWADVDKAGFARGLGALPAAIGIESVAKFDSEVWALNLDAHPKTCPQYLKLDGLEGMAGKWETPLTTLPTVAATVFRLDIRNHQHFQAFPEGVRLGAKGPCELILESLPKLGLVPPGDFQSVKASHCGLVQFSPGTVVHGEFSLANCWKLKALPDEFEAHGAVTIENCAELESLPPGTYRSLTIKGCGRLRVLPEGLQVRGDLVLEACDELATLPRDLAVGGAVKIHACPKLKALPDGFTVGKNVELVSVDALASIGDGVSVGGDLVLMSKGKLARVGEGLRVGADLVLNGQTGLVALGKGLAVGSMLDLQGCAALGALPAGLVAASLRLGGCVGLRTIPDDLVLLGTPEERVADGPALDLNGLLALERMPMGAVVARLLPDPRLLDLVPLTGPGSDMLWKIAPQHLRQEVATRAARGRPASARTEP